jgi:hypothetical protein
VLGVVEAGVRDVQDLVIGQQLDPFHVPGVHEIRSRSGPVSFDDEAVPLQSLDGHAIAYALFRLGA